MKHRTAILAVMIGAALTLPHSSIAASRGPTLSIDGVAVTGSLIERQEFASTAPITVIDKADIDASGLVSVGDILQRLVSQSNAINAQFNNGGDGSIRVGLRGLGSGRTLVLLNGRRLAPGGTGADGSADLNAIPLSIISRIEVLKGGASAIYGSDAIGGVINLITRDDFRGIEGSAFAGTSGKSDGSTYDLNFAFGTGGDNGSLTLTMNYSGQDAVFAGKRDFSKIPLAFDYVARKPVYVGSTATPNGLLTRDAFEEFFDPGNARYQSDIVANCPLSIFGDASCTRDGLNAPWRTFNFPSDLYNFQPENYLITPYQRFSVFGAAQQQLGENVHAFAELLYSNRQSDQRLAPEPVFDFQAFISRDSIYNPYGRDIDLFRRRFVEVGPRRISQDIDTFHGVVGLDGDLFGDPQTMSAWKWEISFNYGRSSSDQSHAGDVVASRLNDGVGPSFIDDGGTPRCGVPGPLPGPGDDAVIAGCVPVDLLSGAGSLTPEMVSYLTFRGRDSGFNEQTMVSAQFTGPILKTPWNGHLSAALGADYRKVSGGFFPDAIIASGDSLGGTISAVEGSYHVAESFVELSFVPVADMAWARSLELTGAARAFDYNLATSGVAWNAGALWRTVGGLSLRGNYSTAFHAPTIGELFAPGSDTFIFATDPCDSTFGSLDDPNVAARCAQEGLPPDFNSQFAFFLPQRIGGGNTELQEETSSTFSAGVVFEPTWIEGLTLSLDYFNIAIDKGIDLLGVSQILANCYNNADANRTNCDQVVRDPSTGFVEFVDNKFLNVDKTRTSGFDLALNYNRDFGDVGHFRIEFEMTYLDRFDQETPSSGLLHGAGVYDLGVYPRVKTNTMLQWDKDAIGAGINLRSIGSFIECDQDFCNDSFNRKNFSRHVSANYTADVFASYRLKSLLGAPSIRIGVNNVLDEDPPVIYNGFFADSDASTYDYKGRFLYVALSQQF